VPSTIRDLTELTTVAVDDYLLISDTSDVTNRDKRISTANLQLALPKKTGTPVAGRVAGWADANTLNDGGFAISDIARLSVAQTYTAALVVPAILSQTFTLATDTATSLTPPSSLGSVIFSTDSVGHLASAFFVYRTSGSRFVQGIASQANVIYTAGPLTGTTGTAGKYTISYHTDGKLYFENRLATTTVCRLLFIA
jgi:hypothetical protein